MATNILLIVLLLPNLFSSIQCFVPSTITTVPSSALRLQHLRNLQPQSRCIQQLHGVLPQWLDVFNGFSSALTTTDGTEKENGVDPDYPWLFTGRLWFRPSIVRIPPPSSSSNNETPSKNKEPPIPPSIYPLHIFGYTIGGTVVLEYDESPVGPYREYVTMGSLVYSKDRGFALGQWGSKLYVSTQEAVDVCRATWDVPALLADIDLVSDVSSASSSSSISKNISVETAPNDAKKNQHGSVPKIVVYGWGNTRILDNNSGNIDNKRYGGLPVLWTPSIKALWAPFVLSPRKLDDDGGVDDEERDLPLHRLRLSASAVRIKFCNQAPSDALGVPLGLGLVVDDVLIEIARQDGVL